MKKKITVSFSGFWKDFYREEVYTNFLPLVMLKKHYDVEIVSKNAEYVFCSIFGIYEYINEPGVRIFVTGEQYSPNFNFVDYAIGYDYLDYDDRYLRMPNLFDILSVDLCNKKHVIPDDILTKKQQFCSFMYSNSQDTTNRKEFFEQLSKYKFVESAGKVKNNTDIKVGEGQKIDYLRKFKFTIAFENQIFPGYHTEKMTDAMAAQTIPIYLGDPKISDSFNEKAFINCANISFDEVIERIKLIDNDDDLYLQILREPAYKDSAYTQNIRERLEQFLINIIEKPDSDKIRRSMSHFVEIEKESLLECGKYNKGLRKYFSIIKNKLLKNKKP